MAKRKTKKVTKKKATFQKAKTREGITASAQKEHRRSKLKNRPSKIHRNQWKAARRALEISLLLVGSLFITLAEWVHFKTNSPV